MGNFNKGQQSKWLAEYSGTFLVVCLIAYSLQIFYHKSFVYAGTSLNGDGLLQHYNALVYYGSWLRQIAHNFFIDHVWSIPGFDLSIGLGGDVPTMLNYYAMGEPWNVLAAFFSPENTEILYNVLVIVRLYIAGIAFYKYCLYQGYESRRILPGAMIYIFAFYTIDISVMHPFFLNPLIYFPIILLGIDKIYKERRPSLFIVFCAFAASDSFYFFYMMTICMFLYGIIRYVQYYGRPLSFWDLIRKLSAFIGYYVLAVMLAAPLFLPSVYSILGSSRVGGTHDVPLFYERLYYLKLPLAFINSGADHYANFGYGVVGCLAVLLLFRTQWKKQIGLKISFLLGCIFCVFPFFGHVLNGFGYATNRWIWVYSFVVALIVVEMMPVMENFPVWTGEVLALATVLLAAITCLYRLLGKLNSQTILTVTGVFGLTFAASLLLLQICRRRRYKMRMAYLVVIALNIFLGMYAWYSPYGGNDILKHGEAGAAWDNLMDSPFAAVDMIEGTDMENVRIDTSNLSFEEARVNSSWQYQVNGAGVYSSMVNASTNEMVEGLRLPTAFEHFWVDLDSRAMLLSAMGMKYVIIKAGDEENLPYGYAQKVGEKNGYVLYETSLSLPMVYWYDTVIDEQDYGRFSMLEKQQSMLQAAAPEEKETAADMGIPVLQTTAMRFEDTELEYKVIETHGLVYSDNRIEASEPGAYLVLETASGQETERYFSFTGLTYEGATSGTVTITDGVKNKSIEILSKTHNQYAAKQDFLCNLGYAKEHGAQYQIIFNTLGNYSCADLKILDQPLDSLEDWVMELKDTPVEYTFGEDHISVQLEPDEAGLLYLAIPYSIGWEAYVDGQKSRTVKTNHFGTGIYLDAGVHTVELEYHTPYIRLGYMLCLLGIVGSGILFWQNKNLMKW